MLDGENDVEGSKCSSHHTPDLLAFEVNFICLCAIHCFSTATPPSSNDDGNDIVTRSCKGVKRKSREERDQSEETRHEQTPERGNVHKGIFVILMCPESTQESTHEQYNLPYSIPNR
ncbi:uncharacterized protein G2W53_000578 [Senna tora]|uniref:Uncharacterized protein n=1 Tax=Senna tora TaxID=362788 RepID=A0A834XI54_9FABA|nr:uncharacterized protein G2W53_000578 [Senna tora]